MILNMGGAQCRTRREVLRGVGAGGGYPLPRGGRGLGYPQENFEKMVQSVTKFKPDLIIITNNLTKAWAYM